jgi:hypothetical protein
LAVAAVAAALMAAAPPTASWALATGGNGNSGDGPQATTATPPSGPTALVTMGDSFISGEGGRWAGNAAPPYTYISDLTDRTTLDAGGGPNLGPQQVYGSTWTVPGSTDPGCHRSDTAEANNPNIAVAVKLNIACSGATTADVRPASDGGQWYKGEAPQTDQLAVIARQDRVKLIVLSIGGNDLGFSDVLTNCIWENVTGLPPCNIGNQPAIMNKMPTVMANVRRTIGDIQYQMALDGYASGDYRLIVQGYPSPLPTGSNMVDPTQRWALGCPIYTADATWANQTLVPEINSNLKTVADTQGAQFLNMASALSGHELCSTQAQRFGVSNPIPDDSTAEWARMLNSPTLNTPATQYNDSQHQVESFHPNAYAQQAFAVCVATVYNWTTAGDNYCIGRANYGVSGQFLWPDN